MGTQKESIQGSRDKEGIEQPTMLPLSKSIPFEAELPSRPDRPIPVLRENYTRVIAPSVATVPIFFSELVSVVFDRRSDDVTIADLILPRGDNYWKFDQMLQYLDELYGSAQHLKIFLTGLARGQHWEKGNIDPFKAREEVPERFRSYEFKDGSHITDSQLEIAWIDDDTSRTLLITPATRSIIVQKEKF